MSQLAFEADLELFDAMRDTVDVFRRVMPRGYWLSNENRM